ncbi:MAG TPA: LysR family transcriptional regulator [Myxococcales bacterium LLY-WYZ-16_1]|jgi:DNA-binding transcriptional LysR family regulator|nr:LysR family transcriptional regulator [Myxococcales bacterium LLY-WYZ-16_1]
MSKRISRGSELRWDDLRVFLAAYRERSLTRAAEALGLNQSTTSRRMSGLEDALGARLFDRTPEGLVPTELAHRILGAAERAEVASHEVARLGSAATDGVAGEVRVAMAVGMSAYVVAPLLRRLREAHPRLRVSFVVSTTLADLTRREADLAVRYVRPTRGDLVAKRVFEGEYALYGSPEFAARLGPGPHAVGDLDFIGWDPEQTFFGEGRWEQEAGLRFVARADELVTRLELARHGVGAIELATAFGDRFDGLVRLDGLPAPPLRAEVYLVTHRTLRAVPRVRVVWELLESAIVELARPH